jgi:putative MATE family efflux protein
MSLIKNTLNFYRDREYFSNILRIALPIATQNLVMASLNMVNILMIGQLGDAELAAVGLAGQIYFLVHLILFGVASGASMFTAQLWGKGDVRNLRRVLGFSLKLGLLGSGVFWALAIFWPENAMRFYSEDPAVIALGAEYLRIFGWSYPFFAVTFAYAFVMRSTKNVRTPMLVTVFALTLGIFLSYGLIFGQFGLPEMGMMGAAWGSLAAKVIESLLILAAVYWRRTNPAAATWRDILEFDWVFMAKVMKPVLPVVTNELVWALGITTYYAIYARVGTEAVAAINIVTAIEQMIFVAFFGIGNATAILVGNLIGEGKKEQAFVFAGRSIGLQVFIGLILGLALYASSDTVFGFYKVSDSVIESARAIIIVASSFAWLKGTNMLVIVGVMRAGGDTRFMLILEVAAIWVVGVPIAALAAFVLHFPVHLVYLMVMIEEVFKLSVCLWRFFSKRWIKDLTQSLAG